MRRLYFAHQNLSSAAFPFCEPATKYTARRQGASLRARRSAQPKQTHRAHRRLDAKAQNLCKLPSRNKRIFARDGARGATRPTDECTFFSHAVRNSWTNNGNRITQKSAQIKLPRAAKFPKLGA
jgi:hypothetical protein